MFSRRGTAAAVEVKKPRLHVFGIEADDVSGAMLRCRTKNALKRRQAELSAQAGLNLYVEISCGGKVARTTTQSTQIDPVWADASLFFGGDEMPELLEMEDEDQIITCRVMNTGVLRHTEIGHATFSFRGQFITPC